MAACGVGGHGLDRTLELPFGEVSGGVFGGRFANQLNLGDGVGASLLESFQGVGGFGVLFSQESRAAFTSVKKGHCELESSAVVRSGGRGCCFALRLG